MWLSPPTHRNGFCGGYGDEQTHFGFFEKYWSNNRLDGVRSWELVRGHVTPVVLFCLMVRTMCLLTRCFPWGNLSYLVARYTTFLATRNVYGRPLQGRQRRGSLRESPFGKLDEYNETEDWRHYIEGVNHFFEANEITDPDKRRSIFLVCVGAKTYKLVRSLVATEDPKDKSYEDLAKLLQDHFMPKPSAIVQRFKFNTRSQQPGETIAMFLAE